MLTNNINLKNFKSLKKNKKITKLLDDLLNEKSEILNSLSKSYKDSYKKKDILRFKKYSNITLIGMGGSILGARSIYNFLKRAPINIETCNFGSVDSIASVVYCAGSKRYCVPNARFLIHSISFNIQGNASFEEKKLNEIIGGLKLDRENISKIIAENCQKTQKQIEKIMFAGKTYNPEEAKSFGLVNEIKDKLFAEGEEIIGIG